MNSADLVNMPIGVATGYAIMGFAVVFLGLVLLMIVINIMGAITASVRAKAAVAAPKAEEAPAVKKKAAPGSAGELKLYNTSERDAAMIMAIVADKMQKPLNELRFISIREVK